MNGWALLASASVLGACRAPAAGAPARNDEVWLTATQMETMHLALEEVKLEEVERTLPGVGSVRAMVECPVKATPEERRACLLVAIDQGALESVRVGTPATARASDVLHEVFPGRVAWIAGTLDHAGRTVQVECLFDDRLGELRPGRALRADVVVGMRPAFAVSRDAVTTLNGDTFVFALAGRSEDGRHRFVRTRVRSADNGGAWLAVEDLEPGSLVASRGDALASMSRVTAL